MEESPYDKLSFLSCEFRNNLDNNLCTQLNPDKINDLNLYFDKNKFSLSDEISQKENISLESCAEITLKNNYAGFTYNNGKNDCLLSSSKNINDNLSNKEYKNYNIKRYIKNKNLIDIEKLKDQNDSSKYFIYHPNQEYDNDNNINISTKIKNLPINECMDECVKKSDSCNSIFIPEKSKICTFYKNKIMRNANYDERLDSYTIKKNNNIKDLNQTIYPFINTNNDNQQFYCYNNINNECVKDLGKIKVEKKNESIPWDLNNNYIEKFENNNLKSNNNLFILLLVTIFLIIFIYLIFNNFYIKK